MMSNQLFIQGGGQTKAYECKSTHTGSPYLKVSSGYLDLTTNTTSGIQLKIKNGNQTYRPLQTYTSQSTKNSQYTATTGYNGTLTRTSQYTSTSGYTGSLTKSSQYTSTSGYSGKSTNLATGTFTGTSATYIASESSNNSTSSYKSSHTASLIQATVSTFLFRRGAASQYSTITTSNIGSAFTTGCCIKMSFSNPSTSSSTTTFNFSSYSSITTTARLSFVSATSYFAKVEPNGNIFYNQSAATFTIYSSASYISYPGFWIWSTNNQFQLAAVDAYYHNRTYVNNIAYFRNNFSGADCYKTAKKQTLWSNTTTRTIYVSSSNSTLATNFSLSRATLTKTASRTSAYATSSTTQGNMSSTTALTKTASRISSYSTSSTAVGNLSSTTALTKTSNRASSYTLTTEL